MDLVNRRATLPHRLRARGRGSGAGDCRIVKLPVFNSLTGRPLSEVEAEVTAKGQQLLVGEDNGEIIPLPPPVPGQIVVAVENETVVRVLYPKPQKRG